MSLVTTPKIEQARWGFAYTLDVALATLHKGAALGMDNMRSGYIATWSIAPNRPSWGTGYAVRDHVRRELEEGRIS